MLNEILKGSKKKIVIVSLTFYSLLTSATKKIYIGKIHKIAGQDNDSSMNCEKDEKHRKQNCS